MSERLAHYVSDAPFDPVAVEKLTAEQERYYMASQWRMMWWRFKHHKLAVVAGVILLAGYLSLFITEFLAPYNLHTRNADFVYAPPQQVQLFHDGEFRGPFIYPLAYSLNMETLKREYSEKTDTVQPIRFFCSGDKYEFWGLFEARFHPYARPRAARSICSAPTVSAATWPPGCSTAAVSR